MTDTKMTKTIGEHWVAAQLARLGWAPALTRDGLERTDILAVSASATRQMIEVQVKTVMDLGANTNWLLGEKSQRSAVSEREWFVLVSVPKQVQEQPKAYVVPRDHVAAAAWISHMHWLTDPTAEPGKRNAPVAQARVRVDRFEGYHDRWDLLGASARDAPILLPSFLRDQARRPEVGLPPEHPWAAALPTW